MAKLQVPPTYTSNETYAMQSWFRLLWNWVTEYLYTPEEVDEIKVQLGTTVATTTGSSHVFLVPEGVKKITMSLSGVSTNGTAAYGVQLGTGGALETTGYVGYFGNVLAATVAGAAISTSFVVSSGVSVASTVQGQISLTLLDEATNTWTASWSFGFTGDARVLTGAGVKPLAGEADRIALVTSDTFDAGLVNITYEI